MSDTKADREPQPHGSRCASRHGGECTCGEFERAAQANRRTVAELAREAYGIPGEDGGSTMDPNLTLAVLHVLLNAHRRDPVVTLSQEEVAALYHHIDALDGWLVRGGFLPNAWAKAQRKGEEV